MASRTATPDFARVALAGVSSYPTAGLHGDIPAALEQVAGALGWSSHASPLGEAIRPGDRVLIKPNLVLDANEGPGGTDCLVTHASVIASVVQAALQTDAAEVLVGDAPIQACDFDRLLSTTGLHAWSERQRDPRFKGIIDFRRTTCRLVQGVRIAAENVRPADEFTLFDLGRQSLLEPVTRTDDRFRVAWYDARLLAKTHHPGTHQYLIANEVLDADVVINLPKLKTHKKAGVTCALKNLIGINGNKEYLPHHRFGGSARGGDCYPGDSAIKRAIEIVSDTQNRTSSIAAQNMWHVARAVLSRVARYGGDRVGLDGSWSGNDTIWRTCLDLNRILLYGRRDGSLADSVQRRVIHIVDAIVAGQGDGPLAPDPLPLGLLLGGNNAAATDWIAAQLLGYEPLKIPLVRHAFDAFRWPIILASPEDVRVAADDAGARALEPGAIPVAHPIGWRDAARVPSDTTPIQGSPSISEMPA